MTKFSEFGVYDYLFVGFFDVFGAAVDEVELGFIEVEF